MPKEIMERRAADNMYMHKDFHGSLSIGLDYLIENYGEESVREYLRRFATTYYAPLSEAIKSQNLSALKKYFEKIYSAEGADVDIDLLDNELLLKVVACPAVMHIRGLGYPVSKLFYETTRTVNSAICEGTPYAFELVEYDEETAEHSTVLQEGEMISCTDFIPAYSELFKFLEEKGGKEAVLGFWNYLSDRYLGNLEELVREHGLRGCWMYWSHTLNEEAADFTMTIDDEAGEFKIIMHYCPSKGRLLEEKHIQPYHDYCGHCNVLYRRVLERLGYRYDIDLSECENSRCTVTVSGNKERDSA